MQKCWPRIAARLVSIFALGIVFARISDRLEYGPFRITAIIHLAQLRSCCFDLSCGPFHASNVLNGKAMGLGEFKLLRIRAPASNLAWACVQEPDLSITLPRPNESVTVLQADVGITQIWYSKLVVPTPTSDPRTPSHGMAFSL